MIVHRTSGGIMKDMKCPECLKDGKKSNIFLDKTDSTLMTYYPHWDYKGKLHNHDPNDTTVYYHCDQGHSWSEVKDKKCDNCDWKG